MESISAPLPVTCSIRPRQSSAFSMLRTNRCWPPLPRYFSVDSPLASFATETFRNLIREGSLKVSIRLDPEFKAPHYISARSIDPSAPCKVIYLEPFYLVLSENSSTGMLRPFRRLPGNSNAATHPIACGIGSAPPSGRTGTRVG